MSKGESRVRPNEAHSLFFGADAGCERWRKWARGHDRSAEYDGSSTVVKKSWFGRVSAAQAKGFVRA